jgi:hypothetical protein
MPLRLLNHARHHAVAYVALFVALGGTSYAAVNLPNGSVTAAKLNRQSIGGYVRAWAHVNSSGWVLSGSPGTRAVHQNDITPAGPNYVVGWAGVRLNARCAPMITLDGNGPVSSRGATAQTVIYSHRWEFPGRRRTTPTAVGIDVSNATDQNVPNGFYLVVVC